MKTGTGLRYRTAAHVERRSGQQTKTSTGERHAAPVAVNPSHPLHPSSNRKKTVERSAGANNDRGMLVRRPIRVVDKRFSTVANAAFGRPITGA